MTENEFDNSPAAAVPLGKPKTKQRRRRASEAESLERLDALLQLKADGASDSQLLNAATTGYGLSTRQAYRILEEVRKTEAALGQESGRTLYGMMLNRTRRMNRRSVQKDDLRSQIRNTELEMKIIERLSRELPSQLDPFSGPAPPPFRRKPVENFFMD
jgi:hypothetical protein